MFEISPNKYVLKSKIIGMKIVSKDGKHWVVFSLDVANKDESSVFSAPFATESEAQGFLQNCAKNLV